jgi:hypothetical protein
VFLRLNQAAELVLLLNLFINYFSNFVQGVAVETLLDLQPRISIFKEALHALELELDVSS